MDIPVDGGCLRRAEKTSAAHHGYQYLRPGMRRGPYVTRPFISDTPITGANSHLGRARPAKGFYGEPQHSRGETTWPAPLTCNRPLTFSSSAKKSFGAGPNVVRFRAPSLANAGHFLKKTLSPTSDRSILRIGKRRLLCKRRQNALQTW